MDVVLISLLLTLNVKYFTPFCDVSIIDFEQVNVWWIDARGSCRSVHIIDFEQVSRDRRQVSLWISNKFEQIN